MRIFCYCPDTGLYQGADFVDEAGIESTEGITSVEPPYYHNDEVPVFDRAGNCWRIVRRAESRSS